MLNSGSRVWSEANVGYDAKDKGVAVTAHCGHRCEVELLAHAICGVPSFVVVCSVGSQVLKNDMVENEYE